MTSGVVVFNAEEFKEIYPHFANLSDKACQYAFDTATLFLDNSVYSPVADVEKRERLLYLLTCHILTLQERGADQVGQITSASEGSVSVGFSAITEKGAEYFSQTQCGFAFWRAMSAYFLGGRYYA